MDAEEENNTPENDSGFRVDCGISEAPSSSPEASGSNSGRPSNVVKEIVKSSDKMSKQIAIGPFPLILNHVMRGTQTPLTLIGVTMPKYNEEEQKPDTKAQETLDVGKTEISVALNAPQDIQDQSSSSGARECLQGPSTSVRSSFSQFRVEAVTVKFSHEAATQATPPHPSLASAKSSPISRDVLQIATSVSSGPKSEVLTVTTDYGSRTPDARSLMLDVIDEDHPIRYINVEPSTPAIGVTNSPIPSWAMPPHSINGQRSLLNLEIRRRRNRWNCRNCFGRNTPHGEEPELLPYSMGPPPTYSGIFREPRSIYTDSRFALPPRLSTDTAASFVAPVPPPSYTQSQGLCVSPYSMEQIISVNPNRGVWSPRPTATVCPRCATVVVTAVEVRRSAITHVSALILFLCGCWPCCLIPYCVDSCKSTNHYCPICRTYLGTYTPW